LGSPTNLASAITTTSVFSTSTFVLYRIAGIDPSVRLCAPVLVFTPFAGFTTTIIISFV
jgi:hypothetical protein